MTETLKALIAKWRADANTCNWDKNRVFDVCAAELESALAGIARPPQSEWTTVEWLRANAERLHRETKGASKVPMWLNLVLERLGAERVELEDFEEAEAAAGIARPPQDGCIGCDATKVVGYTIDRKPGPFCYECWSLLKLHVAQVNLLNAAVDREELSVEAARPTRDGGTAPLDAASIHALITQWRAQAKSTNSDYAKGCEDGMLHCADELEALAASAPPLSPDSRTKLIAARNDLMSALIAARNDLMSAITSLRGGYPTVMDACDEAIAALDIAIGQAFASPASPPRAWHPMDAAPKDGTPILCVDQNGNREIYRWTNAIGNCMEGWRHGNHVATNLTRWTPLPEPPLPFPTPPAQTEDR